MDLKDVAPTDRGIGSGTINGFTCYDATTGFPNNGTPAVGEEISGGGTWIHGQHTEGANVAQGIGDLYPTQGVMIMNNSPNHGVVTGIHLSKYWGAPLSTVILENGTGGQSVATTNNIMDDFNGNTLTRTNNQIVPLYVTDNSGKVGGVFTLANPLTSGGLPSGEIANGVSVYAGAIDIWSEPSGSLVDEFHADNTGLMKINNGLQMTGAPGAATTISTTTTNANLILAPNGSGSVILSTSGTGSTQATNFSAAHYLGVQASGPSCLFTSGGGTTPVCSLLTGSTDSVGTILAIVSSTGTPAGTGTITLTYNSSLGTNGPSCVFMASDGGTGTWNGLAVMKNKTATVSSDVFTWTNGTVPTPLTNGDSYWINYFCGGR